jgi:hypothetical protein
VGDNAPEPMVGVERVEDQSGGRSPEWKVLGFRWRWRTLSRHFYKFIIQLHVIVVVFMVSV